MARRPAQPSSPPPPAPKKQLTVTEMQRGIERLRERIAEIEAFDVTSMTATHPPAITGLQVAVKDTLVRIFGEDTADFRRFSNACELQWQATWAMGDYPALSDYQDGIREKISHSLAILSQAIRTLEEEIADAASQTIAPESTRATPKPDLSKVFVVHGHDDGARHAMARFLEKIELEAIILQEQPDQGLTIIEKFETYANQVGFAVVLLTPDDIGGAALAPSQASRARQNVIFELGYFAGKLGRGRACLLRKGDVEIPSDLYGVIYTNMDADEGWKLKLAKELKAAGLKFDGDKVF
jgi:predicted nucleotide-binding protein